MTILDRVIIMSLEKNKDIRILFRKNNYKKRKKLEE